MSYINRAWMAASVAVVNTHSDQGQKLKSGLKSLNHGKKRYMSGGHGAEAADFRPVSGFLNSDLGGFSVGEDKRKKAEESLHQVMYLNCWA